MEGRELRNTRKGKWLKRITGKEKKGEVDGEKDVSGDEEGEMEKKEEMEKEKISKGTDGEKKK